MKELLYCLLFYAVYRLLKFPYDVWWRVRRIKKENEALRRADEKYAATKTSGDKTRLTEAVIEWADVSGLTEAATERNERRIQCSNFGAHARPQEGPWPGGLETVAAFFRRWEKEYDRAVFRVIRKLRLTKPLKPTWG